MNSLINQVKGVFKNITYPKDNDFYKAIADRDYLDVSEINSNGKEKKWEDISKEELLKYYDFIFFLNEDKEKIYYLPAYLTHILSDIEVADSAATESLLMELASINKEKFTSMQLSAVIEFLNFLSADKRNGIEYDDHLVNKALNNLRYQ
jgi:hypothetical protein